MTSLDAVAATVGRTQLDTHEYRNPAVLEPALQEYTMQELADAFDVTPQTIRRWKNRHRISTPRDCNHGDAVREGVQKSRERREKLHAGGAL